MDSSMLSAADIAAVTRGNCGYNDGWGFGNGNLFTILILFALFGFGGFGGFGWGNRAADGRVTTIEDLNNSANFSRLENQVRFNENTIQNGFANLSNGICQLGYQSAKDFGALEKDMAECCCGINRNIDGVNYNVAAQAAAINANINEKFAALEKGQLMQTINAQASQINDLRLSQALCGVVRYPLASTYSAGTNPFCGSNCCGLGY